MTAVPPSPIESPVPPAAERGRGLAVVGYGLLIASLFTGGLSAFLALILAHDRKGQSGPVLHSHFAFQIRIFWICFALSLAGGALGIGGLFTALMSAPPVRLHTEPDAVLTSLTLGQPLLPVQYQSWSYHWSWGPALRGKAMWETTAGTILFFGAVLFSWVGPVFGLSRLASGRPIGDRRMTAPPTV